MARTKVFDEAVVLEKAMNLFWRKGYNGTSAQDLVDGLGISRSSLYDTFTDKRTLFIKAMHQYRLQMGGAMIAMVNQSTNIRQTIQDLLQMATKQSIEDQFAKGCFMVNSAVEVAPHDTEIAQIVNSNMQDIENALCRAIQKGQAEGQFTKRHSAQALARFLFNTISGIRVAAKSGADGQVYNDVVEVALSAIYAS